MHLLFARVTFVLLATQVPTLKAKPNFNRWGRRRSGEVGNKVGGLRLGVHRLSVLLFPLALVPAFIVVFVYLLFLFHFQ